MAPAGGGLLPLTAGAAAGRRPAAIDRRPVAPPHPRLAPGGQHVRLRLPADRGPGRNRVPLRLLGDLASVRQRSARPRAWVAVPDRQEGLLAWGRGGAIGFDARRGGDG